MFELLAFMKLILMLMITLAYVLLQMIYIDRNGQRSPYSREGLFDFTKGKIFECGDKCSCKDSCKLRMAQSGVAYPLVVCRVGGKGHGVMTTKVSKTVFVIDR